jgi:hypothetical protein
MQTLSFYYTRFIYAYYENPHLRAAAANYERYVFISTASLFVSIRPFPGPLDTPYYYVIFECYAFGSGGGGGGGGVNARREMIRSVLTNSS